MGVCIGVVIYTRVVIYLLIGYITIFFYIVGNNKFVKKTKLNY